MTDPVAARRTELSPTANATQASGELHSRPQRDARDVWTPASLGGFYALYFGSVGIILPFLPAYLKSLSLSGAQVGILLALSPLLALVAPPAWGHLADRLGRPDRVLRVVAMGAFLAFAPLLVVENWSALFAVMCGYACFASSITPLVDSLTLEHVAREGGSYARIRLFGSLGFVLSSSLFGLLASRIDRMTVIVPLCLIGAYFLWSLTLRSPSASVSAPNPLDGLKLLRRADLAIFLSATCLHWIACAPFHGMFSIHVRDLHLASSVVGLSAGLGVLAETGVMYLYPRFATRISPRHLLFLSFLASAARWLGMSLTSQPQVIILLSLLHGLTFGAFYVASISFMAAGVPRNLRASGQALFASATFGLGGLIGYLSSGIGYDALGGHRLFATAAAVELLAAALILKVTSAPTIAGEQSEIRPALG